MHFFGALWARVSSAFFLCIVMLTVVNAADIDVMLELVSALRNVEPFYPGWNAGNISNYCVWTGVKCDANGRVTHIELAWDKNKGSFSGSVPPSIANLNELMYLDMSQHDLIGDIPPQLFALPKIQSIGLGSTGMNIVFPTTFASTLRIINLNGCNISSTLPSTMPYSSLVFFKASSTRLRCPFPTESLAFLKDRSTSCNIRQNSLTITDGKVCGQIPVEDMSCLFETLLSPPTDFSTGAPTPPTPLHTVTKYGFHIEVLSDRVNMFGTYMRKGVLTPYREEYMSFVSNPWSLTSSFSNKGITWPIGPFEPQINWPSEDEFRIKAKLLNGIFEVEWRFIFKPADAIYGAGLKYTIVCTSIHFLKLGAYSYPTDPEYARVFFPISIIYRMPHSAVTGSSIKCDERHLACGSSVANTTAEFRFDGTALVTVASSNAEIRFSYALNGTLDGAPLLESTARLDVDRDYWPIGGDDVVDCHTISAPSVNFDGGPLKDQFTSLFFAVSVDPFNKSVVYDPDLSIRLLFGTGEDVQEGMSAAVIAAIVIVVVIVVLAISIAGFKMLIWPRLSHAASTQSLAEIHEDEAQSPARNTSSRWQSADATGSRLTNDRL